MAASFFESSTIAHHDTFNCAKPKKEPAEMSKWADETAAPGPIMRYEGDSIVSIVDAAHASIVRERAFFTAVPRPQSSTMQAPPLLTTSSIFTDVSDVRIDPDPSEQVHWACNCPSACAEGLPLRHGLIWPPVVALGDLGGVAFAFLVCWLMPRLHLPT
eukprot:2864399-Prymnesium_polylepis.1